MYSLPEVTFGTHEAMERIEAGSKAMGVIYRVTPFFF